MSRERIVLLFTTYSYALNLLHGVLNLLPHFLRTPVWRMLLGKLGKAPYIDYGVYFRYPKKIYIGDDVGINRGYNFYAAHLGENAIITIGNKVAFGPNVTIFTGGHDYTRPNLPDIAAPVTIHDYVWVGGNSTILPGVTIGQGAVIGAGSVVTRDVPAYSVAVGNPARVVKHYPAPSEV